jgi:hypothetical protein
MPGRVTAGRSGDLLEREVAELGRQLGLEVRTYVRVGRRLWGKKRIIDVVFMDPTSRRTLGIECKAQDQPGTAEEKIPSLIQDIAAWPISGIVVFRGAGFSREMESYLLSTGKAVALDELEEWLRLFFAL